VTIGDDRGWIGEQGVKVIYRDSEGQLGDRLQELCALINEVTEPLRASDGTASDGSASTDGDGESAHTSPGTSSAAKVAA
jgi:hypothetical protein